LGRSHAAAKNGKKYVLYLLNEKHGIHSVHQDEVPEICFLLTIIGWGESGKTVLYNETIVYNVNSFSSLLACYLVRLD